MDAIGIDIGSTNVKAVLVDGDGDPLVSSARPLTWQRSGATATQDAGDLWVAVLGALADLAAGAPGGLADVGSIGLCGQYSSIVPVDADLYPLAPMRLYLDTRGTAHCFAILERHPEAFEAWISRHPVPPVGGGLALGHVLAFQHDEPEVHEAAAAYLEPVDYVVARLTGTIAATQASMFAGQLIDNRELGRTEYDPELVGMAGVDRHKLPPLVAADAVVGEVRNDLRAATGLPAGVQVVAGMTDSHAAALATGADSSGRVGMAIGTTGVVLATTDHLAVDLDHEVLAMPGIRPDEYLVWAENGLAGRAVEHVLDRFVHADDALGAHGGGDPFAGFEDALAASPPGAGGALFLPWLAGALAPQADPSMRGGFLGVSLDTTRVDLVRAAVEGVCQNLRWLLGPVEAFGTRTTEVVLAGGAARSPAWSQLLADVLARPVQALADPGHAGARAVASWALLATVGKVGGGIEATVGLGSHPADRYEPDPETAAVHDATFTRFTAAFEALRPLRFGDPA